MKFIKSLRPELVIASCFALAALIAVIAGQNGRNPYFMIAAAVLVVATYVTCPPRWVVELSRVVATKFVGQEKPVKKTTSKPGEETE
jgi:hypothetical protein